MTFTRTSKPSSPITLALICHKEGEKLALVLEDIKKQKALDQVAEVLLFQNGTCEKTRETAKGFVSQLPLKIFSSSENHLGKARAFLVQKAQCDRIAWTDSDCRLEADWLEKLLHNWAEQSLKLGPAKDLLAVGGPNRLPPDRLWKKGFNLSLSVFIGHGFSPQAWKVKQATRVRHIPTCNGLFLKKAILEAGNFSTKQARQGEDLELGLKMHSKGELFLFPEPEVINHFAETYFMALKRLFRFGTVQSPKNNRFYYPLLFFTPILSLGLILNSTLALSVFYESLPTMFNIKESLLDLSPTINKKFLGLYGIFNIIIFFLLNLILFFTRLYFLSLVIFSFMVLIKRKKTLALSLPFFWLAQHYAYSLGINKSLLSKILKK